MYRPSGHSSTYPLRPCNLAGAHHNEERIMNFDEREFDWREVAEYVPCHDGFDAHRAIGTEIDESVSEVDTLH